MKRTSVKLTAKIVLWLIMLMISVTAPCVFAFQPKIDINRLHFDHVVNLGMKARPITTQDNDGYMWFCGHGEGLFRYDGYELKHYGFGSGQMVNGGGLLS